MAIRISCVHVLAGAGVDDRVDAVLFEHDVPLNGGHTLIFASLHEPVSVGRARAEHLENDDGGINNGLAARSAASK